MRTLISRIAALPKPWLATLGAVTAICLVGGSWAAVGALSENGSPTDTASPRATPAQPAPSPSERAPEVSGGGGNINNEVVLINKQDGRKYHRAGFGTARVTGDSAVNKNAAAAFSSCADCRTIAVAAQIVLIMGDVSTVSPQNLAIAINQNCRGCTTAAFAYQYVITTPGIVHFTAEGQSSMAAIRAEISDATGSDLDPFALEAKLDGLIDKLWTVVDQELVAAGAQAEKVPKKARDVTTSPDSPAATPFPSSEPSPSTEPSPVPDESPSEQASPTPSPSPSATPLQ